MGALQRMEVLTMVQTTPVLRKPRSSFPRWSDDSYELPKEILPCVKACDKYKKLSLLAQKLIPT